MNKIEDRIERIERVLIDQYEADANRYVELDMMSICQEHKEREEERLNVFRKKLKISKELLDQLPEDDD